MTDAESRCHASPTGAEPLPGSPALFSARDLRAGSLNPGDTAEQVAQLAVPRLAEQCTVYYLESPDHLKAVGFAHVDPRKEAAAREIRRRYPIDLASDHIVARVIREGRARILPQIDEGCWERVARDEQHLALLRVVGHRSGMVVPLEANGRIVGAMSLATSECERTFTAQDLIDAEDLGRRGALAIENARLHEELHRSQERYRAFVSHSTEGIWCCEMETPVPTDLAPEEQVKLFFERGYMTECNDAMARMYGFETAEEILGARLADIVIPTDPCNHAFLLAFIAAGYRLSDAESHEVDRHGEPRYFSNSMVGIVEEGRVLRAWGTQREITERKQVDDRLRQAERMEMVGRLAGGVAHDFNNMLCVILGYSELSLSRTDLPEPARRALIEIQSAGARAASLTAELLAFGRKQLVRPRRVELRRFLTDAATSVRSSAGGRCEVRMTVPEELPAVYVDPNHLLQIVRALVVNAAEAMPEGGPILINAFAAPGEAGREPRDTRLRVCLAITDGGPGLDEQTRQRLFEPFFSTLAMGQGTGLGLATVLGTVEQNGGTIEVISAPGKGTTFQVFLPTAD